VFGTANPEPQHVENKNGDDDDNRKKSCIDCITDFEKSQFIEAAEEGCGF
jgi:hypothetical protein